VKSKRGGKCKLCGVKWSRGDEIAILLGSWVHPECKTHELTERLAGGRTVTLPAASSGWGSNEEELTTGKPMNQARAHQGHTRGIRKIS